MTPPTSNIIKRRRFLAIPIVAAALAAVGLLPAVAGAANPHHHRFTVVAHNDEGTITPADFFDDLVQNSRASVDAPVYRNGEQVGATETILTVTRGGDDPTLIIECSVELPDGNVLFNGSFHLTDVADGAGVPVVGGTGRYTGARGILLLTVTDPARPVLAFDFSTK